MLFTTTDIEKLSTFRQFPTILNIYEDRFNTQLIIKNIFSYYEIDINNYLSKLADFIIELDMLFSMSRNERAFDVINDYIKELNNNFENSNSLDTKTCLLFINNFFTSIFDLLKALKVIVKFDKSLPDSYKIFFESDSYLIIYDYSREINSKLKKGYEIQDKSDNSHLFHIIDHKISTLDEKFEEINRQFNIINSDYELNKEHNFEEQREKFENKAQELYFLYQNYLTNMKKQYENELEPEISDLNIKLEQNRSELDALLGDVKLYQDKMTNKAVSEMSAHYYEKAKFERKSYFAVTIASAIIIIFSVVSAFRGVNGYYNQYVSTEACDKNEVNKIQGTIIPPVKLKSYEECMKDLTIKREATQKYAFNYLIFRLSFSLLLFLAVIYASRIAMRAYNHWRQSENMYLKLNTLSPFIGSLDKSVRNDVHLSLVPDYFGKDAGMVESSKEAVKDLPTNISNIAIKAIEQAGSTIGSKLGSDKETKNSDSESSTEKNKKKSADDPE